MAEEKGERPANGQDLAVVDRQGLSDTPASDAQRTLTARPSSKDSAPTNVSINETGEKVNPQAVDWDGEHDPHNPLNWSATRRWLIVGLVSANTFNTSMAPTMFAPAVPEAQRDFNDYNTAEATLLISIFVIGLAIGPLFLAPATELYGRTIATHVSNVTFLVATVIAGVSVNIPMMLVFRLIMGIAAAVPATTGGGVVADLNPPERRGRALSIWILGPLLGPVIGPVAGGYLAMNVGWRWTYWLIVILSGVCTIGTFIFYRETYAPRILSLKAKRLEKETGTPHRSKFDKGQQPGQLFRNALIRPTKILFRSPIVLVLSLYVSIVYSYLYLLFTTFTEVFEVQYGFNTGEAGLVYLGLGVGFLIGQISLSKFSDAYLKKQKERRGENKPEDRLPPLVLGSFIMPIGLFWYGWTAQYNVHWIVPIIGTGFCGLGIIYVFLPVQMYLVDAFTLFASSAIAASIVVRSIFGTCIPLAGPPLYARLGFGWGNSLLGFIALVFAFFSILLLRYGEALRKNPRFQLEL